MLGGRGGLSGGRGDRPPYIDKNGIALNKLSPEYMPIKLGYLYCSQDSSISQDPIEKSSEEDALVNTERLTDRTHPSADPYAHVQSSVSHSMVGGLEQADDDVEIEDEEVEQAPLATSSLAG